MKDFHDLKVWQKSHELTLAVYRMTATFPREELYGLTSQRDLILIKPKDHEELAQRATELKRMLAGLMQKLSAER